MREKEEEEEEEKDSQTLCQERGEKKVCSTLIRMRKAFTLSWLNKMKNDDH